MHISLMCCSQTKYAASQHRRWSEQPLSLTHPHHTGVQLKASVPCLLHITFSIEQTDLSNHSLAPTTITQVFGCPEHVSTVLCLCFDLLSHRTLSTAADAAACLLSPLLPYLAPSAEHTEAAAYAVVDLLKHCVEAVGGRGAHSMSGRGLRVLSRRSSGHSSGSEGGEQWLLCEQSSGELGGAAAGSEGEAQSSSVPVTAAVFTPSPLLALLPTPSLCTDNSSISSVRVAALACEALHALQALPYEAHARRVAMQEGGVAALVVLLGGAAAAAPVSGELMCVM